MNLGWEDLVISMCWGVWGLYGYILWRWGRWQAPHSHGTSSLRIAVLIPARNEATHLPDCIESILAQWRLPDEIWVIDDHSEDETLKIACQYAERVSFLRVLSLPEGVEGKKAALLMALRATHAEIIVTTDADTRWLPDTLEKLVAPFAEEEVQAVGGWIQLEVRPGFLNAFQRIEMAGVLMLTAGSWRQGEPITANGALLAYRRKAFDAVGGWGRAQQHPSGDDDLLIQRIQKHFGHGAVVFSSAVAQTSPPTSWRDFLQQRLRWLSKRHLYPLPWTGWGLRLVALAHWTIASVLLWKPQQALIAWGLLTLFQAYIASKGFQHSGAPFPSLKDWLLTAVVYPFYQVGLGLLALFRPPFQWKGRRYR